MTFIYYHSITLKSSVSGMEPEFLSELKISIANKKIKKIFPKLKHIINGEPTNNLFGLKCRGMIIGEFVFISELRNISIILWRS